MYASKYATEATVESFIRYKTSLESGVLNQASRLKFGDNTRLLLGSKAAKLAGVYTPMAAHFRNQSRWSKTRGTRKHPQILQEFRRKGGLQFNILTAAQKNVGGIYVYLALLLPIFEFFLA